MRAWRVPPDIVSVNLHEADAEHVVGLMHARGIGVESGIWSLDDAERYLTTRMTRYSLRALVEMPPAPSAPSA